MDSGQLVPGLSHLLWWETRQQQLWTYKIVQLVRRYDVYDMTVLSPNHSYHFCCVKLKLSVAWKRCVTTASVFAVPCMLMRPSKAGTVVDVCSGDTGCSRTYGDGHAIVMVLACEHFPLRLSLWIPYSAFLYCILSLFRVARLTPVTRWIGKILSFLSFFFMERNINLWNMS